MFHLTSRACLASYSYGPEFMGARWCHFITQVALVEQQRAKLEAEDGNGDALGEEGQPAETAQASASTKPKAAPDPALPAGVGDESSAPKVPLLSGSISGNEAESSEPPAKKTKKDKKKRGAGLSLSHLEDGDVPF